jgi:hypothetical protein
MSGRVHIFADDPWWEAEVERYLVYCLGRTVRISSFQFAELDVCDRETFAFDAAVAGAFRRRGPGEHLEPSGIELFVRFPGRVVLLSPLWLEPPPKRWPLCVREPLDEPARLVDAVRLALAATAAPGPGADELYRYLPAAPVSGAGHHPRSAAGHGRRS